MNGKDFRVASGLLVCPSCRGTLVRKESEHVCETCGAMWGICDGIPVFTHQDYYFYQIPRDSMNTLLDLAEETSIAEAVEQYLKPNFPSKVFEYAFNEKRADWTFLLDDLSSKVIADVGCGWGTIAIPLARRAERVYAVDATFERVRFLNLRLREERIENVISIHGDALTLPLPKNSVDVVLLIHILEWLGKATIKRSPRDVQEQVLRNMSLYLRNGGRLVLGIENRINIKYFLGLTDHGDLPFTPFMPRLLANWLTRLIKRKEYRTYTYTRRGYEKLLSDSGYQNIQFYDIFPSYRHPLQMISYDRGNRLFSDWLNLGKNQIPLRKFSRAIIFLLEWGGVAKYQVPDFIIIAEKK